MTTYIKQAVLFAMAIGVISCSGTNSSNSSGGSNPPPVEYEASVNIGNISTIPLGNGSSGNSSITVTNNLKDKVVLIEATYTITANGVTSAPQSATEAGSLLDTSQCSSISPTGVCSINVLPPPNHTDQAQYVLNMNYLDSTTGKTYLATNVIGFSDTIPVASTGVRYSTLNNNVYNTPGGSTTITIPFQLTESFSDLTAPSKSSNPIFAPTISCPGNSYAAGTLCNLYIRISNTGTNPTITGDVTISGTTATLLKATKSSLFGVPITVFQNTTGNLVTSAINVMVSPSDNSAPQAITLLNNGTAAISSISINGITPVTISSNTCGTSLSAGASCTFNVNVNSNVSGQSAVSISYNNGSSSNNPIGLLVFNVIYISHVPSPGLSLVSGQGNLNNIPINFTKFANILVSNTGNTTLNNIRFTTPSSQAPSFSWESGSCSMSGNQSLGSGESCTLVLKYSPTSQESGTLHINAAGEWRDQSGNPQTYGNANFTIAYSSINGEAFLYITPNYVSFAIRADGHESALQTFTVVNAGLTSTIIDQLLAAQGVPTFNVLPSSTCSVGKFLNVNESCTIDTQFGATSTTIANIESQIRIGYKPDGSYTYDVYTFSNLVFNSSLAAYVTVSNIAVTGTSSGSGTSSTPYLYTNTSAPGSKLAVIVTYVNNGTESAESFNVTLNNLPVGYVESSTSSTCGIKATTSTLHVGESCTAAFYAVNPIGLYNPYSLSGTGLGFNIPGFSYVDASTGLNTNKFPTWTGQYNNSNNIYVTTSLFASVTTTSPTWAIAASGGTESFTFSGTPNGVVITIPTGQLNGFTVGNSRTCTISGGSCIISITSPANFPAGTNYFSYYVTPAGVSSPSANNSIIQQASFILN